MRFISILSVYLFLATVTAYGTPPAPEDGVVLGNKAIRITFDAATGELVSLKDLSTSLEFLDRNGTRGASLWKLELGEPGVAGTVEMSAAGAFHVSQPDAQTLVLEWSRFSGIAGPDLKVRVKVRLRGDQALSAWNISLSGVAGKQLKKIVFPNISGLRDMGNEELAVPVWMGELRKAPRTALSGLDGKDRSFTWRYPGPLSLQMLSLYNPATHGFYAACNDAQGYAKQFSISLDSLNNLGYQMNNYPVAGDGKDAYTLPYDAVIGAFKGDWISAAKIYKAWGVRQAWCQDSRFRKHAGESWADSTALWVWNRGRSGNVLTPAVDLRKRTGLPVNVLWHWWHGSPYDDGFPEYFPPKEGDASFKAAVRSANQQGVKAIVYMNSFQWGTSTQSFEKEHALNWAVKNEAGGTEAHVFNIFTHHSLTPMCMATRFWKEKYAALADKAINEYHTGGVYMDQACLNYICYDTTHGHPVGGGNYWVKNFGTLTQMIRTNDMVKDHTVLAGEGCGECWLPYLDAFLTLQVSKERYAGVGGPETIPFFQAVYHAYGVTFGSYSSLVSPPYDELWPKGTAPESQEQPLGNEFNDQFFMEQARSFVWGMQPTIANYHPSLTSERKEEVDYLIRLAKTRYKGLKYLLYGEFMRAPHIDIPYKDIPISRLSIYAGQQDRVTTFREKAPLLYTAAWKAKDGQMGIAVASISGAALPLHFAFKSSDYSLSSSGKVYVTHADGRRLIGAYKNGEVTVSYSLPPKDLCIIEIVPDASVAHNLSG
ncbi:DUF6259 domain-containing protein [Compostibacter hankyongensis]|uniref:DUF6259 domain-containing protein n=1 Tax=Compostibacter hankyongensis TaxID=1007089 RepID=A0ABP8G495_9BACT